MNRNKLVATGSKEAVERLKYEIANELGITLGAETMALKNGTVGGQMTKRLVELGQKTIANEVFPKKK